MPLKTFYNLSQGGTQDASCGCFPGSRCLTSPILVALLPLVPSSFNLSRVWEIDSFLPCQRSRFVQLGSQTAEVLFLAEEDWE